MRRVALFVLAGLSSGLLHAVDFDGDYETKAWSEIEVQLPSSPVSASLLQFKVGAVVDKRFFVDMNAVSVGSDGVVRYSLVVLADGGGRNVSYEGMRCLTGERRFYAFGRADGTWSKARGNQWVRILGDSNNHHVELFSSYFCPSGAATMPTLEDVRAALLRGGSPGLRPSYSGH